MTVDLTDAIINLGWEPPSPRTPWDVLPLVTMADGDLPAVSEIPSDLRKLVSIRHPRYHSEFQQLDLHWMQFPALSRLGFDIGGVQYTATPFIGWFMDAEIGVRNLADTFRYNCLPKVVKTLGLSKDLSTDEEDDMEMLAEHERLLLLSRAQSELNYAVKWSFDRAGISMTDTLTASLTWSEFDDDHHRKHGYRLPADPYWLSPPQGSIVPLWHRGGAPNYQPKPMICRHFLDPIKVLKREMTQSSSKVTFLTPDVQDEDHHGRMQIITPVRPDESMAPRYPPIRPKTRNHKIPVVPLLDQPYKPDTLKIPTIDISQVSVTELGSGSLTPVVSVHIFYCSSGITAKVLAKKLYRNVQAFSSENTTVRIQDPLKELNELESTTLGGNDIVLVIASTTGTGEIPSNGTRFVKHVILNDILEETVPHARFRYSVFGNGDSSYGATYNGAAKEVEASLIRILGSPIAGGLFEGDTNIDKIPWKSFNRWWTLVRQELLERPQIMDITNESRPSLHEPLTKSKKESLHNQAVKRHLMRSEELRTKFDVMAVQNVRPDLPTMGGSYTGLFDISIDVGKSRLRELGHVNILPINLFSKVAQAVKLLGFHDNHEIILDIFEAKDKNPTTTQFLISYIDLERPFRDLDWMEGIEFPRGTIPEDSTIIGRSALDVLNLIRNSTSSWPPCTTLVRQICLSMEPLQPRTFSVASSNWQPKAPHKLKDGRPPKQTLRLLVRHRQGGRFSDTFIRESETSFATCPMPVLCSISDSAPGRILRNATHVPIILIATGAGFAPIRSLLEMRTRQVQCSGLGTDQFAQSRMALFLGMRESSFALVVDTISDAAEAGLFDSLVLLPSNSHGVRVQDRLADEGGRREVREKLIDRQGIVYICASPVVVEAVLEVLGEFLGGDAVDVLGERLVTEAFDGN